MKAAFLRAMFLRRMNCVSAGLIGIITPRTEPGPSPDPELRYAADASEHDDRCGYHRGPDGFSPYGGLRNIGGLYYLAAELPDLFLLVPSGLAAELHTLDGG